MTKLVLMLAASLFSFSVMAQDNGKPPVKNKKEQRRERINELVKQEEDGVITYKKHFAVGAKLTSDGYGIFFEKGKAQSIKKALLFQIDISERKHQKEEKLNYFNAPTNPIIYGKLNFFYPVKLGVQEQFLLGNKANKNGVSVTGNVGGGISLGLLRPYEIQITDSTGSQRYVKYDSPDSTYFIDSYGDPNASGPGFGTGWNSLKVTPGLYVKTALRFDYGKYNEMINAIEVGLTAEYYTKNIPQMLYNKQKKLFFSAYFSIMFGKRK